MESSLLTDLCSVCHLQAPKYKCPRCATRTCSLDCSKRHKTRSGCTGERDKTAFVPKAKLLTPAGVDHDFNFITSIEKQLANNEKALETQPRTTASRKRKTRLIPRFWELAQELGIRVIETPAGMSRERRNKSQVIENGKHILFSIEWTFEDESIVMTRARDCETLLRAYDIATKVKAGVPKTIGVKRKKEAETLNSIVDYDSDEEVEPNSQSKSLAPKCQIYLIKEQTSGSERVLAPVNFNMTLAEALKGRTIVEFPTFKLLEAKSLPPGYIFEEDYEVRFQSQQKEMMKLAAEGDEILRHQSPRSQEESLRPLPSTNNILESLRKDIKLRNL